MRKPGYIVKLFLAVTILPGWWAPYRELEDGRPRVMMESGINISTCNVIAGKFHPVHVPAKIESCQFFIADQAGILPVAIFRLRIIDIFPGINGNWIRSFLLIIAVGLIILFLAARQRRKLESMRRDLEEKIKQQKTELSQSVDLKEMLISIITHDMINPLRHIGVIADILERGVEKNPEQVTSALRDIRITSEKILSGSQSIVTWIKYDRTHIVPEKKSVQLYALIDEALNPFIIEAATKNIELLNQVQAAKYIVTDPIILGLILNRLISNAVRFTASGTVKIVSEEIGAQEDTVIKVSDTGNGMSAETLYVMQEVLNGNLAALKSTTKVSTGLGYVLIAGLIKIESLQIAIDSNLNQGTTVSIRIS